MKPVVYVDILFLLNFLLNTATVYISAILIKNDLKLWRLVLSSALLSLYACIMFFPQISFLYSFFGKAAALVIGSAIAFRAGSVRSLIKNTLVLFLITAALGGIIFALIFLSDFGTALGSVVSNGELYLNVNASTLVTSVLLAYVCIYIVAEIKRSAEIQKNQLFDVTIYLDLKKVSVKGFWDTGCTLSEPLGRAPAIIINQKAAKMLLGDTQIPNEYLHRYRPMPYSTIDNKGIIPGIFPDKVEIDGCQIKKCIIAVSAQKLSPDNTFDALFGTEIFNEAKKPERTHIQ